jgi:hypothetical protein
MLRPYDLSIDTEGCLTWPDTRAGLAVEDRDLRTEADNADGCFMNMWATMSVLYPPIFVGTHLVVQPSTN